MIPVIRYRDQAKYFDIEGILRARRLDWVGKTLRTTIPSLAREVLVSRAESNIATKHCQEGSIMMDVPPTPQCINWWPSLKTNLDGWNLYEKYTPRKVGKKFLHKTICGSVTLCATQPIDPEAEEWYTGAQNIQFNEWFKTTKSKESK